MSILLYEWTKWHVTKRMKKKLDRLLKNYASNIEQILEVTLYKAAAVWPPTAHHENYLR